MGLGLADFKGFKGLPSVRVQVAQMLVPMIRGVVLLGSTRTRSMIMPKRDRTDAFKALNT